MGFAMNVYVSLCREWENIFGALEESEQGDWAMLLLNDGVQIVKHRAVGF